MLLPFRTSIWPRRTPYANYALIAVNVIIFLFEFQVNPVAGGVVFRPWVSDFMLTSPPGGVWQFVSYAFLHGGFMHIFGNMFFLYLFGNNVNDKLGHTGYLCFYLGGAVFSGMGHIMIGGGSVLGASGAVAAVTGAYLVLFPQTLVTVVYWFIFIGTMDLPAMYFIAFKMIFIDNMLARGSALVAYDAHLSGYAFGILGMLIMLGTGLIQGNTFDLWSMLRRWNQRRRYRDVVSSGHDPFVGRQSKKIRAKEVKKSPAQLQVEKKIRQLRDGINKRITERNISAATELYLELMEIDGSQVPPRQYLLDIANQLASENQHTEAAGTYEKFLTHYGNYEHVEQGELLLGLRYSRYLEEPDLAVKHLKIAADKLSDPGQLKMCRDELAKLAD